MELCECWIKHYNNDLWQKKLTHGHVIVVEQPNLNEGPRNVEGHSLAARPIRSTTQIWVVTHHQYGISLLIPQMSFCRENAKCWLFSQAKCNLQSATFIFFFLDKVTDAKTDSTFQCRQWLIYQWLHPSIDPTLPGYQWQSMHVGNFTHKRIWEMHGERVM